MGVPASKITRKIERHPFGMLGVHYFYVGKIGMGLLYLFTGGLFGIGWIVDIIRIIAGVFRDKDGFYLRG